MGTIPMSTRSQIRFVESGETRNGEPYTHTAQMYKHSDGYPSNILPALKQLFDVERTSGTIRGVHYAAANFIFLQKLQGMGLYLDEDPDEGRGFTPDALVEGIQNYDMSFLEDVNQPFFLLGYGVEEVGRWHGDEEYLYVVDLSGSTEPAVNDEPAEWTVRVSGHNDFPRWDVLDDYDGDPWDEVSWQFEGPLSVGVEQFTDD